MTSDSKTPSVGRQKLLNTFVDFCEAQKVDPNTVASAALYLACIAVYDRLRMPREVFLDMCASFWDNTVSQRDVSDARERLNRVLDDVRN